MFAAYHGLDQLPPGFGPSVVTVGNFDGVHAGHTRILREVIQIARARQCLALAVTFHPHPTRIVAPDRVPPLLTTPDTRVALFEEAGLDAVLVLPFTPEVARLEAEEFARSILAERLAALVVVVGPNFRFGRGQAGDVKALQELGRRFGFEVRVVEPISCRGALVSSSLVRRLITEGAVSRAARLLGRPFAVEGRVIRGHGVGAKQTVPTLNLAPDTEVLPCRGVYVTQTSDLGSRRAWPSVTNIGFRPTFDGSQLSIETFLLRPLDSATPERISVAFWRRLRDEIKFPTVEALREQILRDAAAAEKFLRRLQAAQSTAKEVTS